MALCLIKHRENFNYLNVLENILFFKVKKNCPTFFYAGTQIKICSDVSHMAFQLRPYIAYNETGNKNSHSNISPFPERISRQILAHFPMTNGVCTPTNRRSHSPRALSLPRRQCSVSDSCCCYNIHAQMNETSSCPCVILYLPRLATQNEEEQNHQTRRQEA
jgi:hypothetical protein